MAPEIRAVASERAGDARCPHTRRRKGARRVHTRTAGRAGGA